MKDRVALITGGAQGIGLACARLFAERGAKVVLADVNAEKLNQSVAELSAEGAAASCAAFNVANADEVEKAVNQVREQWGKIDILVNNAGITRDQLLMRMKKEDWDAVIAVNLTGAFLCTRAVVPGMMKQRWGRIVNIASVVGRMGNVGQANYIASKAGIIGLTKATAQEAALRNVTANAVAPGFIQTAMTANLPETARERLLQRVPLARMGTDRDVAAAVRFLASEEAGYITGHVLDVNGGMYMA